MHDSILSQRKKELHNAIGTALESTQKNRPDERPGVLADHFERGEDYAKAAAFLASTIQLAMNKVAIPDAIEYAKRRIACLERLPESGETQRAIIDARTGLGHLYLNVNRFVELKQTIDPVVKMAEEIGYHRGLASILSLTGAYFFSLEDFPKAIEYFQNGIRLAEATKNMQAYGHGNNYLGLTFALICEFERARVFLARALDARQQSRLLWITAASKCNVAFYVHGLQGQIEQCYQMTAEALRMAEESGDIWSKGYVYLNHGMSCYAKGLFAKAEAYLLEGGDLGQRIGHDMIDFGSKTCLSELYLFSEDYARARQAFDSAAEIGRSKFWPSFVNMCRVGSALCGVMRQEETDLPTLRSYVADNRVKIIEGRIQRYMGGILLHRGDQHLAEAEDLMKKAIEADQRNGIRFYLAQDHLAYAELLRRKGDLPRARGTLQTAASIFTECCADGWVKMAEERLAKL